MEKMDKEPQYGRLIDSDDDEDDNSDSSSTATTQSAPQVAMLPEKVYFVEEADDVSSGGDNNIKAAAASCDKPCVCISVSMLLVGFLASVGIVVAVWSAVRLQGAAVESVSRPTTVFEPMPMLASSNSTFVHAYRFLSRLHESSKNSSAGGNDTSSEDVESMKRELLSLVRSFSYTVNDTLSGPLLSLLTDLLRRVNEPNASIAEALEEFRNEFSGTQELTFHLSLSPATSCSSIYQANFSSPSGYYWLKRASDGSAVRVYCDMKRSCGGNVTGGWMRVAALDFDDYRVPCPPGFEGHENSRIRTCGIDPALTCASVVFDTSDVPYTRVCGKVLAYQFSTPNAFKPSSSSNSSSIDSNYVDGVSLTHGSSPRRHIWTFAAALDEYGQYDDGGSVCECSNAARPGRGPPAFVGRDYFCDSGISREFREDDRGQFFAGSPLWDGAGCSSASTCCSFNDPPWFSRELPAPTSDPIEMRVCEDERRFNEDISMSNVEIYVQ